MEKIIKTFSKIVFMVPVTFLAVSYLLIQKLKYGKVNKQKCMSFLMDNMPLIGFVAILFWVMIVLLIIKLSYNG